MGLEQSSPLEVPLPLGAGCVLLSSMQQEQGLQPAAPGGVAQAVPMSQPSMWCHGTPGVC